MITERMYIKDWFQNEIINKTPWYVDSWYVNRQYIEPDQIVKESEKAYCVRFNGYTPKQKKPSAFVMWMPKSVLETKEEREESDRLETERRNAKFKAGQEKHDKLLQIAKDHGIKGVRKTMKTSTLLSMIVDAGIEVSI